MTLPAFAFWLDVMTAGIVGAGFALAYWRAA